MRTNPLHIDAGCERTAIGVDADHVLVVVSDVEIGAGGPTDDFAQSAFLGELLLSYNREPFADMAVTVVFNGDTFDLLKTPIDGSYPTRITADVAVAKVERVLAAHQAFCRQLRQFLAYEAAPRRLVFIAGNHDLELFFPEVQARLRTEFAKPDAVDFAGHTFQIGDVFVEHGSQSDPMFAVDVGKPFIELDGKTVLNLPWGTLALLEVALPRFQSTLYALDRLRPRRLVLERVPQVRKLLMQSYWRYWTREYWHEVFNRADKLHRVSWQMLKEVVHRLFTGDPDVESTDAHRLLRERRGQRTFVVGHRHDAAFWMADDRRVLQTGCFRNEYYLDPIGNAHRLAAKVYAEVFLHKGVTTRAHLVEVQAPEPSERAIPERVADVIPEVERLLREIG